MIFTAHKNSFKLFFNNKTIILDATLSKKKPVFIHFRYCNTGLEFINSKYNNSHVVGPLTLFKNSSLTIKNKVHLCRLRLAVRFFFFKNYYELPFKIIFLYIIYC